MVVKLAGNACGGSGAVLAEGARECDVFKMILHRSRSAIAIAVRNRFDDLTMIRERSRKARREVVAMHAICAQQREDRRRQEHEHWIARRTRAV